METLGLSHRAPKSRHWLLELLWPRLSSAVEADTALRNGMYVCFACAIVTALVGFFANVKAQSILGVVVAGYLVFLGIGVRAGSRIAALTAFAYYALSFATSVAVSPSAAMLPVVQIIVVALLLGAVRAAFFRSSERRRNAASDSPPELPETAFYESAPPALVALARRDRGFEERIKKGWTFASPMPQLLVGLSWCFILFGVLFGTVMRIYTLPTGSMEPTFQIGDNVMSLNYPFAGSVRRGDAVAFRMPYDRKITTVKRVAGLPGDHIQVRANQLILNGKSMSEPYIKVPSDFPAFDFPSRFPAPVYLPAIQNMQYKMYSRDIRNDEYIVPANSYFVLGDNRGNSLDSRYFGAVPRADLAGRLIYVYGNSRTKSAVRPPLLRFSLGAN